MKNKPITPAVHCAMDYALSAVLMSVPAMIGLNSNAKNVYRMVGGKMLTLNSLTDAPGSVKKMIPMRTHKKADAMLLAATAAMTFLPSIRKDKKALSFHLGFLAMAAAHYMLTDYQTT